MHTIGSAGVMNRRLPVGFRFNPTDEVLIAYYLALKINGFPLPNGMDHVILCVNFYDHNPQELIGMPKMGGSELGWYFLTEMEGSGKRCSRKAKDGFWKATAKDKPVCDRTGSVIGHKRSLDFYQHNKRTEFKMHEYTSSACVKTTSSSNKMKYWVLKKIYKNKQVADMKIRIKDHDDDDDHYFCESSNSAKRAKKVNDADFNVDDYLILMDEDQNINQNVVDDHQDVNIMQDGGQLSIEDANFNLTDYNQKEAYVDDDQAVKNLMDEDIFAGLEEYMSNKVFTILPNEYH